MKLESITVVMPTLNRHELLPKVLKQYPHNLQVVVVDGTKKPFNAEDYPNVIYLHKKAEGLADARNAGLELAAKLNAKYICQVDDDSFVKDIEKKMLLLAGHLKRYKKLGIVGGMGGYTASWRRKIGEGLFYSSWCSCAYMAMTRAANPIRFRVDRREDLCYSLDSWIKGKRVALDTRCVVDHRDMLEGGIGEERHCNWYLKYVDMLREMYDGVDFITIRKDGMAQVRFKKIGIDDRWVEMVNNAS